METQSVEGRRVVFQRPGVVAVEGFQVGPPKPGQVLVRTVRSLISPGTETAFLTALPNTSTSFPQYPGYSNAGVVEAVGEGISKLKPEDRVASSKSHASHVLAYEDETLRIPENVSFDQAAFVTLICIALNGVRRALIELGEPVLVIGQGLVGQLALQLAKLHGGLPVMAVDYLDGRLEASRRLGADHVFNPGRDDLEKALREATDREGAPVVIEATGNPEAILMALRLAAREARVVLLGSSRGVTREVNFYSEVHRKGVSVIGAHNSARPRVDSRRGSWSFMDDARVALRLLSRGALNVMPLISLKVSSEEAPSAYRALLEEKETTIAAVLDWEAQGTSRG